MASLWVGILLDFASPLTSNKLVHQDIQHPPHTSQTTIIEKHPKDITAPPPAPPTLSPALPLRGLVTEKRFLSFSIERDHQTALDGFTALQRVGIVFQTRCAFSFGFLPFWSYEDTHSTCNFAHQGLTCRHVAHQASSA